MIVPISLETIELRTREAVGAIEQADWDRLASGCSPFLTHAWLASLEDAGCVEPSAGWLPTPLTAIVDGRVVGAAPLYIKGNSFGEFVYDWSWAELAHRLGVSYYPKLVVAVPFSPVTGQRLLVDPALSNDERSAIRAALIRGIEHVAEQHGLAGAHVLFPKEAECGALEQRGWFRRLAYQYWWRNRGYEDFEAFLSDLKSKRRREIRRERRRLAETGIRVEPIAGGDATEEVMDDMFRFYATTCEKFAWGRQYLNREFFALVHERLGDRIRMYIARDDADVAIAGAFCLRDDTRLYGRYWGCDEEVSQLHFETCYYRPIEDAIALGLDAIEPGTGGDHKYARGFEPSETYSMHRFWVEPLGGMLARFCEQEGDAVDDAIERMLESSPLRPSGRQPPSEVDVSDSE